MISSVNKTLFGKLLRTYQRRAGVRQNVLAAELNISPSAMSQMMSGRLIPSAAQLETLGAMLHLTAGEFTEMCEHLARIRKGTGEAPSAVNDFLRAARLRAGYSIGQLADATGIAELELANFENCIGARPTPLEAVRIGTVLGVDLDELYRSRTEKTPSTSPGTAELHSEMLHDHVAPYHPFSTVSRAPLVRGSVLLAYEPSADFPMDYCWRHMDMMVESSVPGIAIVRVAGRELGLMPNLFLELEVVPGGACGSGMFVLGMGQSELVIGELTESGDVKSLNGELCACRLTWPIRQFRGESLPQIALEKMQNWHNPER